MRTRCSPETRREIGTAEGGSREQTSTRQRMRNRGWEWEWQPESGAALAFPFAFRFSVPQPTFLRLLEPIRKHPHHPAPCQLPERMLSMLHVERVPDDPRHLRAVFVKAIAHARIEQRVGRQQEFLRLDALRGDVGHLFCPRLIGDEMKVDLAVESGLRAQLHAGVELV